jgi:hypothetical protein
MQTQQTVTLRFSSGKDLLIRKGSAILPNVTDQPKEVL